VEKARDATTTFTDEAAEDPTMSFLPPSHKFSINDIILLTLQPNGSGDFFGPTTQPTNDAATSAEARVLNTGPSYIDIVLPGGAFEKAFGPAPNNVGPSGKGSPRMRLRVDRFFSNVPYQRMVAALGQLTSIPERSKRSDVEGNRSSASDDSNPYDSICMDELLREVILSSYSFTDPSSVLWRDTDTCDLQELARRLARPPLPNSSNLANQALQYMQSNPHGIFGKFNGPQLTSIGAALTRRLTLIQGPPGKVISSAFFCFVEKSLLITWFHNSSLKGTGKTTVGAAIGFGFVHQCRTISSNTKVLACASSNVGADNMLENLVKLGLNVVRVGKASAISQSLWNMTLDAAIDRDPKAQKALANAAYATGQLSKASRGNKGASKSKSSALSDQTIREVATAAVKASINACNIAATKALREADVIVTTLTGASDPRLLAACGIVSDDEALESDGRVKDMNTQRRGLSSSKPGEQANFIRVNAPDNLPPLSLPFVIIDEACQSVEPASIIPLTASNSCRSLVLLGDPCQLPPTVRSSLSSPLSISLMERMAAVLPSPVIVTAQNDQCEKEESFLAGKPTKQAISYLRNLDTDYSKVSYRKKFAGSLLLSVQYRMHPSIAAFSSAIFYDGMLSTPSFLGEYRPFPEVLQRLLPSETPNLGVRFVNVGGRSNEHLGNRNNFARTGYGYSSTVVSEQQTSFSNEEEASCIISLIKSIVTDHRVQNSTMPTIGVVTPYTGQVELIKSMIAADAAFRKFSPSLSSPIEVKSVDGYQGRERDIIIFSGVRSNRSGNVGFLTDWRRMNVALTRSRTALVVFGDMETLIEGDKHWAAFTTWCKGSNCIISNFDRNKSS
jgi:AAA domain